MALSERALDRALAAIFAGPLFLGLLAGESEMVDDNYSRQPVRLSPPRAGGHGRIVVNADDVRFAPFTGPATLTGWVLLDAEGELVRENMPPVSFGPNDAAVFRPGDLKLEVT